MASFKATACQRSLLVAAEYPLNIPCPSFQIFIPGWFFEDATLWPRGLF